MGKKEKRRAKHEEAEGEEGEAKMLSESVGSDDDDAEANEDLSLKIVEKALLMQSAKPQNDTGSGVGLANDTGGAAAVELATPSSLEVLNDTVAEGPSGVKKKKKRKKTAKKMDTCDQPVNVITSEEKPKAERSTKSAEAVEGAEELAEVTMTNAVVEEPDNAVLRKLLRGPRYFDPPDSGGWPTCYNCGEEGHTAVNCPSLTKRQRPCFVCGGLGHGAKQCPKGQDCFICKSSGHRAKDCPEKYNQGLRSSKICLKCASSGHDMFSCKNDYPASDLKGIQCYICKGFGHLCCANDADDIPREVSCYKCGEFGHTGLACSRLRVEASTIAPSSLCYKCGEGGHFARECSSPAKAYLRSAEEAYIASPSLCYKCGGEGHFARECSSSAKARLRVHNEESNIASPSLCYKCGGGGHFARECSSSVKSGKRHRESATPRMRKARKERSEASEVKSAPNDLGKAHKRRKTKSEERGITTPRISKLKSSWISKDPGDYSQTKSGKSKHRGRWIAEDPQDLSLSTPRKSKRRGGWTAEDTGTMTPGGYRSHSSNKKYARRSGTPVLQGSAPPLQHRFSASRFGDSNSDGISRNYDMEMKRQYGNGIRRNHDLEMKRHYGDGIRRNHDWW